MEQQKITNGGLQFVPQIAVQYVYLDFDGELTFYNGEILTVDNVKVQNSSLTTERIAYIVTELNAQYADRNVIFVTEKPTTAEYSTIYVGKTSAFDRYGNFAGLAETIDSGNKNKTDKAFVMLDSTNSNEKIISTISHETDHLLGVLNHGGSGLAAYADRYVGYGISSYGVTLYEESMFISSRGNATSTTLSAGGNLYISGGGFATNTRVHGGSMYLYSSGSAANTRLDGGSIYLYSGGSAANTNVERGTMHISGGYAYSTTISSSGCLYVSNGGTAKINVVDGGKMYICSGGTATSTYVNYIYWVNSRLAGGELHICNGAIADGIWNSGRIFVSAGGTARSAYIRQGHMYVSAGGSAINTSIHSEGKMIISSGGTATGINAESGAALHIAVAPDTYIQGSYAGSSFFMQNAQIYNYTVNQRCQMDIFNGGCHKGSLNIAKGGVVSAYQGSVIEFTLTDSTSSSGYLINNLSAISGSPTYTIVLSANQQDGIYKLAQGANNFDGSITVSDGSSNYGSVKVNGTSLVYRDKHYSLKQSNGNLTLTIGVPDTTPPSKPTASANITSPTNSNVIVIANFSYDSEIRQYSYNNSAWYDYTTGIELSSNKTVYFRGMDAAGNVSAVTTFTVSNIDKEKPILRGTPTVTVNGTRATFSWNSANDNVKIAGYNLVVNANTYYVDGTSYTLNNLSPGNYTFRLSAYDTAGNTSTWSSAQSFTVSQQTVTDTIAPTISSVKLTQGADNYIFTATVNASDNKTATANLTYQIKYAATQNGLNTAVAQSGKSFTLDAKAAGKTYYYQIGVTDEAGNTSWSSAQSFYVKEKTLQPVSSLVVTTASDVNDANDGVTSLREALDYAATLDGEQTITFAGDYKISIDSTLNISSNVVIDGESNDVVISLDSSDVNVFNFTAETLIINNVDFIATNQNSNSAQANGTRGQLLLLENGNFYLSNSSVEGFCAGMAALITRQDTYLQIDNCFFSNNIDTNHGNGGAVQVNGNALINNTTFVGNQAGVGGALFTGEDSYVNVVNCSFVNNKNTEGFYGISIHGQEDLFIQNSIVVDGSRTSDGIGGNMSYNLVVRNSIYAAAYTEYRGDFFNNISGKNVSDIYPDVEIDFDCSGNKYLEANPDNIKDIAVLSAVDTDNVMYYSIDGKQWYKTLNDSAASSEKNNYLSQHVLGNRTKEDNVVGVYVLNGNFVPRNLHGSSDSLRWDAITGVDSYIVEYSTDNFANVISFETTGNKVDSIALPSGTYQWRVKVRGGETVSNGENIAASRSAEVQKFVSDADGNMDVFFGNADKKWEIGYAAEHQGILNGWNGSEEQVKLTGKNKIADVFSGSTDANVLILTDDANGDALFLDDIFTAFGKDTARIAQINEIRTGFGDDIVDMTSQRFAYVGDGVKVYGGLGNDTIWANNGNNTLFGDAGNDRIVGGANNDVIAGGIGNDRMHGGGGSDIFCFGDNWGRDSVEQLAGGSVTLWFEDGSASNWNATTLTYTDGENSVTVSGVSSVTLKFGADVSLPDGCFAVVSEVLRTF